MAWTKRQIKQLYIWDVAERHNLYRKPSKSSVEIYRFNDNKSDELVIHNMKDHYIFKTPPRGADQFEILRHGPGEIY